MELDKKTNTFAHPQLKEMLELGYYYDDKLPSFTRKLIDKHIKIPHSGAAFIPYTWHINYINSLQGWKNPAGYPAFNNSFCYVSKKNGKSAIVGILALSYSFIYKFTNIACLATTRDQTKNVMDQIRDFILADRTLSSVFKINKFEIKNLETNSIIIGKSGDGKSQDGVNARIVLFDEYVHWKDTKSIQLNDFYEGAIKGCGLDYQLIKISTASEPDPRSLGLKEYRYSKRLLSGELKNHNYLPVIFEAPQNKKPMEYLRNKKWWYAANPTMSDDWGHIKEDTFERDINIAYQKGNRERDSFLTLYLNVWRQNAEELIVPDEEWMSPRNQEEPQFDLSGNGKPILIGVDPASVRDCTSISIIQYDAEGRLNIKCFGYNNEERAMELSHRLNVPFLDWKDAKVMTICPGGVQDLGLIKSELARLAYEYKPSGMAFDKAKSFDLMQFSEDLCENIWEMPQTPLKLTPAILELQRLAAQGLLRHGANPFLRYCISNTYTKKTPAGLYAPFKKAEWQFIDGTASLLTALAVLLEEDHNEIDPSSFFL